MFIRVHPSTFFLRLDLYDIDKILSSMSPFITLTIFSFLPLFVLYYINLILRLRVNIRGVSVRIEKYTDHITVECKLVIKCITNTLNLQPETTYDSEYWRMPENE